MTLQLEVVHVQGAMQLPSHLEAAQKPAVGSHEKLSAKSWQTSVSEVCHTRVTKGSSIRINPQ